MKMLVTRPEPDASETAARLEALGIEPVVTPLLVYELLPADADLRGELLRFAEEVQSGAQATSAKLTDIMLAQDFHDLTGQTVGKVVEVATTVEDALLQLLLETSTAPAPATTRGPLDGPVADSATRTDVVANQAQVDDLLASLGF